MTWLLSPFMSRLINIVYPVDKSRVLGSTVHAKAIHVMAEVERQRLYGSQKKANIVEGAFVKVYRKIT